MFKAKKTVSVAPMMKWTDRHCRFFHRSISKTFVLYTEMISCNAVIWGDREKLLNFNKEEHPLVVQLGGSDPKLLAKASKICENLGYNEINLNIGCPSPRVTKGRFGACLMTEPKLVGECVYSMKEKINIPVSVKCRIGVDDMDEQKGLDQFVDEIKNSGVNHFIIHARKAILKGLNPKQNREIPPLNYQRVKDLKKRLGSDVFITLNGGIKSFNDARNILKWADGIMIGREAYRNPYLLNSIDSLINYRNKSSITREDICEIMSDYATIMIKKFDVRLHSITRHMLGLYFGLPGARLYRKMLSEILTKYDNDPKLIIEAAALAEGICKEKGIMAA